MEYVKSRSGFTLVEMMLAAMAVSSLKTKK